MFKVLKCYFIWLFKNKRQFKYNHFFYFERSNENHTLQNFILIKLTIAL